MARVTPSARILAGLLLFAGACGTPDPPPDRPHLLVITVDTLRADLVGCSGEASGHTPHIDALAARGTLFCRALCPMGTTLPSHSTMFTGLYPHAHDVRWNGDALQPGYTTLAEVLQQRGYRTGAFVAFKSLALTSGLEQGFDVVAKAWTQKRAIRPGSQVNEEALTWLDREAGDRPTFTWVHYFEPHSPYPLTPYAEEGLEDYDGAFAEGATVDDIFCDDGVWNRTDADAAALRHLYEGRVRDADALVGELVAGLEERGLMENTVVVLASDHGQLLGEHHRVGHGELWSEVLDVPLVIVDPREAGGREVHDRVGLVDLTPTVLDLLGIEPPAKTQGRSIARAIRGETLAPATYVAEVRLVDPRQAHTPGQDEAVAIIRGDRKLVLETGRRLALFDLELDPREENPLPPQDDPEQVAEMRRVARRVLEDRPAPRADTPELDEETLEELRALGYLGGTLGR